MSSSPTGGERNSPVLVCGFNRPDLLAECLSRLTLSGRRIYVSLDGPRSAAPEDQQLVAACVRVTEHFIARNPGSRGRYSPTNLGTRRSIEAAISWTFEQEDTLIVVEDDIHVSSDFLDFVDELLLEYKDRPDIGSVGGSCLPPRSALTLPDHRARLSDYTCSWGWATWRDRWILHQRQLGSRTGFRDVNWPESVSSYGQRTYWKTLAWLCRIGALDTWDYEWQLSHWILNWKTVVPNGNLVTNVGFGPQATHTTSMRDPVIQQVTRLDPAFTQKACTLPALDHQADEWLTRNHYRSGWVTASKVLLRHATRI